MIRFPLAIGTLLLVIASGTQAHSGRTDASGGHNCSAKSKQKGLCTGYHYHADDGLPYEDGTELRIAFNKDSSYKTTNQSEHRRSHSRDHAQSEEASI